MSRVPQQLLEDVLLHTLQWMWCLHDGAPAQFSVAVWERLARHDPGCWIGHYPEATVLWPPWSSDHFSQTYANTTDTRQQVVRCTHDTVHTICTTPVVCERV